MKKTLICGIAILIIGISVYGIVESDPVSTLNGKIDLNEKEGKITSTEIYFDASQSMKGYILGDGGTFNGKISKLFDFASNHKFFTIGASQKPQVFYGQVFDLNQNLGLFNGGDTRFEKLLPEIGKKSGNGKVCFLVTDGIVYINHNTSIALEAFTSTLKNSLSRVAKGKGVAVYKFSSRFNGRYFNMNNTPMQLNAQRPYYIIAIGDKADIKALQIKAAKTLEPEQEIYFGLHDMEAHLAGKQIEDTGVAVNPNNELELTLTIPECMSYMYQASPDYYSDNLTLRMEGQPKPWDKADYTVTAIENGGSVNLNIKVKNVAIKGSGKLVLCIANVLPKGWESISIDDDTNISNTPQKTFGLKYLLNGIKGAVEKEENIIKVTFDYKL